jgi:hypothetical protein
MSADPNIYADVGQLATLHDGAAKLTDCATLQEAVSASLHSAQKIRATVKVIGVMNLSRRPKNGSVLRQQAKQSAARAMANCAQYGDSCWSTRDGTGDK